MEFEWNENKRLSNVGKHGYDFLDSWKLFEGAHIRSIARQGGDGEERFLVTGFIDDGYAMIVYTMRNGVCRVISLRKARANEQRRHQALYGE